MTILERVQADTIEAMKTKDALKRDTLRAVKSAAVLMQKEAHADAITDEMMIKAINREKKIHQGTIDSVKGKTGANVDAAIQEATYKLNLLDAYLPKMMPEEEVAFKVNDIVNSIPEVQRNMGTAMKAVMAELKGKADNKLISQLVKKALG